MKEGFYNGTIIRGSKDYLIWSKDKGVMAEFDSYAESKAWCSEYYLQNPHSKLMIIVLNWSGDGWRGEEVCLKPISSIASDAPLGTRGLP